jgi:hypothetical protein
VRYLAATLLAASIVTLSVGSANAASSNQPKSPATLGVLGYAKAIGEDPIDIDASTAMVPQLGGQCIGGGAFLSGEGCVSLRDGSINSWGVAGN